MEESSADERSVWHFFKSRSGVWRESEPGPRLSEQDDGEADWILDGKIFYI